MNQQEFVKRFTPSYRGFEAVLTQLGFRLIEKEREGLLSDWYYVGPKTTLVFQYQTAVFTPKYTERLAEHGFMLKCLVSKDFSIGVDQADLLYLMTEGQWICQTKFERSVVSKIRRKVAA